MVYNPNMNNKTNNRANTNPDTVKIMSTEFSNTSSMNIFDKVANGEQPTALDRTNAIRDVLAFSSRDWSAYEQLDNIYNAAYGEYDPDRQDPELTAEDANEFLAAVQGALQELPEDWADDMEINQLKKLAFSGEQADTPQI